MRLPPPSDPPPNLSHDDGIIADMDYVEVIQRLLSSPVTPDTTKTTLREELISQLALDPRLSTHSSATPVSAPNERYVLEKFLKRNITLPSMSQDDIVM